MYRLTPRTVERSSGSGMPESSTHCCAIRATPCRMLSRRHRHFDGSEPGRLRLIDDPANGLVMVSNDLSVLEEALRSKRTAGMFGPRLGRPHDLRASQ